MRRVHGLFVLLLLLAAAGNVFVEEWDTGALAQSPYGNETGFGFGISEHQGVYCEVNGVRLFAKTAEDCQKASGEVTHIINTTVAPVGEPMSNPN